MNTRSWFVHTHKPTWFKMSIPSLTMIGLDASAEAIAALPRPVVHIKGFASRMLLPGAADPPPLISPSDQPRLSNERSTTEALANALVDAICASEPKTLVWDGDAYAVDSFTALIPLIALRLPGVQLAAFAFERWGDAGFVENWAPPLAALSTPSPLTLIIVPKTVAGGHTDKYVALGRIAIGATGSKLAFCLGGGAVTVDEAKLGLEEDDPPIKFVLAPVRRFTPFQPPDGAEPEPRPLEMQDSKELFAPVAEKMTLLRVES